MAQQPSTTTDEALEEYGVGRVADDESLGDDTSAPLDDGALAVAWQSWDIL